MFMFFHITGRFRFLLSTPTLPSYCSLLLACYVNSVIRLVKYLLFLLTVKRALLSLGKIYTEIRCAIRKHNIKLE